MTTTSKDLACLGGDSFRLDLGLEESALMARVLGNGMENGFLCDLVVVLLSFFVPSVGVDFFVSLTIVCSFARDQRANESTSKLSRAMTMRHELEPTASRCHTRRLHR